MITIDDVKQPLGEDAAAYTEAELQQIASDCERWIVLFMDIAHERHSTAAQTVTQEQAAMHIDLPDQ
jgi:hypothetical protein